MRFVGIDPSTQTGFCVIDENANVIVAKVLSGIGNIDPMRMSSLVDDVRSHLRRDYIVAIEGFSYGSKGRGIGFQFGLGWALRLMMYKGLPNPYIEVPPSVVKKFAGAKGNSGKDDVKAATLKTFGLNFANDNVNDAYILARYALERWKENDLNRAKAF